MTPDSRRRWLARSAACALLVLMVALSPSFGFTWDERFQQAYGERIWKYLHGQLPRSDFDTDFGNEPSYGGLVELACVAVQHVIPGDIYVVRHAVISVFGWLGILFCGRLASRFFGARAGWLAAGLLAVSPRYFGESMNNPKDLPFAALAIVALYYILTMSPRPPHLSWSHASKMGAAIALAMSVRPLGLMLIPFAALVLATFVVMSTRERQLSTGLWIPAMRFVATAVLIIPAATVFWPWAQGQPFTRPIEAFVTAANAKWAVGFDVLYGGQDLSADALPWHYLPVWVGMTLPPVVLAGVIFSPLAWRRGREARIALVGLGVFAVAPIVLAIVRHATLYDAARHVLFVVPPLTILAAAGWDSALNVPVATARIAMTAALVLGVFEPLMFQVRNHPNQIVYFNPLAGGPRSAFDRYEMDYWGNSVLQATKWAADLATRAGEPVVVIGNHVVQADAGRYHSLVYKPRGADNFHLDIRLLRGHRDPVRETAERPDVLYSVKTADGTPLCVILPGPAYPQLRERLHNLAQR